MRRWLGWIAIAWLLGLCALALLAYGGSAGAQSLDGRTQGIASQLRCPVCQGESVADSQADVARSMRAFIRRELTQGIAADRIKAELLARYPGISLSPSTSGVGSVAWFAPPLLLVAGCGLLGTLVLDWRGRGRTGDSTSRSDYVARVRAEVARDRDD